MAEAENKTPNYVQELFGTCLLSYTVAEGGNGGLILAVLIYGGGHISGANYNPAVSLCLFLNGTLDMNDMVIYMVCQYIGAVIGMVLSLDGGLGYPVLAEVSAGTCMLHEILYGGLLCYTVLNVAISVGTSGNPFYGAAIGGVVMAGVGIMNPAIGLVVFLNNSEGALFALFGSFIGAVWAAFLFKMTSPKDFADAAPPAADTAAAQ